MQFFFALYMFVIGFEGSANKLGIGIMKDEEILCNERITYITPAGTGFSPSDTAKHHRLQIIKLLKLALNNSGVKLSDIDLFAYTKGPGMAAPLIVVATVAKTLAFALKKPLIPVNHCIAHIEMGRFITKANNPTILYVSGGNTQVISFSDGRYRIFGETLDIAIGNCLDRVARHLNLSNLPCAAANLEKMALKGTKLLEIPYVVKGMDVSYSGILSHCLKLEVKSEQDIYDICYSVQEVGYAMLVEVLERAMSITNSKEALVVGGVGCNKRLQLMVESMVGQRNGNIYCTDERFCIDNGLMIAYTGMIMKKSGCKFELSDLCCQQRYRTDMVEIKWR